LRRWHQTDPKTGLILLGIDGSMAYDEWEHDVRAEVTKSRAATRRILSDRRRLYPASSAEFLKRCVEFFQTEADLLGSVKWAVLSTDRNAVYGSARMVEILAEDTAVQIEAFIELEAALKWLLPESATAELDRLAGWVERAAGAGKAGPDTPSFRSH
jgi:hypothetical protein